MKKILLLCLLILILVGCTKTNKEEIETNIKNSKPSNSFRLIKTPNEVIRPTIIQEELVENIDEIPINLQATVEPVENEPKDNTNKEQHVQIEEINKDTKTIVKEETIEEIVNEQESEETINIETDKLSNEVEELTLAEYVEEEKPKKKMFAASLSATTQYWVYDVVVRAYDNSKGQVRQALASRGYNDAFATQFLSMSLPFSVGHFATQDSAQQFIHSLEFYAFAKCDLRRVELR